MNKILVIEDNEDVRELVKTILVLKDFTVVEAPNGRRGIALAAKEKPDLIILDLILPDIDGLDVCKILKKNPQTEQIPILMLTARKTVLERVKGLETGADDYLIKPFDTLELLARAKALLRRQGVTVEQRALIKIGNFEIDPATYTLTINEKPVTDLTPKEFDILYVLMKNSPEVVRRDDMFQVVWGKSEKDYTRVVDIHVTKLRKKLKEESKRIKTIPGKGYFFSPR